MKPRKIETLDYKTLTSVLDYDPASGLFRWKECKAKWLQPGDIAGCNSRGYVKITINQTHFFAHRLAWFYFYKKWPDHEIDHINLDRSDNRIKNLRAAIHAENSRNARIRKHNTTGYKGVIQANRWSRRFIARITVDGKQIHVGTFDTPQEAHAAYVKASIIHHRDYGRSA